MPDNLLTFETICESAAFLVAAIDDPRTGLRMPHSPAFRDGLNILRRELEVAGFMAEYRKAGRGGYGLP